MTNARRVPWCGQTCSTTAAVCNATTRWHHHEQLVGLLTWSCASSGTIRYVLPEPVSEWRSVRPAVDGHAGDSLNLCRLRPASQRGCHRLWNGQVSKQLRLRLLSKLTGSSSSSTNAPQVRQPARRKPVEHLATGRKGWSARGPARRARPRATRHHGERRGRSLEKDRRCRSPSLACGSSVAGVGGGGVPPQSGLTKHPPHISLLEPRSSPLVSFLLLDLHHGMKCARALMNRPEDRSLRARVRVRLGTQ